MFESLERRTLLAVTVDATFPHPQALPPDNQNDVASAGFLQTLSDGKIVSGLFLREEGAVLVLADQQGKEVRVQKDQVDQRITQQLSPMPANFGEQITEADFVHLLGFLLEQRVKN